MRERADQAGTSMADDEPIELKDGAAITGMRRAGALVASTLALLRAHCAPGVATAELDALAHEHITSQGGVPSFLGYPGPTPYPSAICASINDEVVHGIPGPRQLREGDIVTLDVGAVLDGWHGDAAITVAVGAVSAPAAHLIATTEAALAAGIAVARAGNRLGDISAAIERVARRAGCGIVPEFTGHGIGHEMHEAPTVRNYVDRQLGSGPRLRAGMTFTIEPIFTLGAAETETLPDGWTICTRDHGLAAHVEHTVAVAAHGPAFVLTRQG
ncbi:MAG TPA: type I methionyl aminopeptidase [Thermomicrobiales bacterium]|nr:type I methionyl aminopeptidase [Thermomicrobiales bacterium]